MDAIESVILRLDHLVVQLLSVLHLIPILGEQLLSCFRGALVCLQEATETSRMSQNEHIGYNSLSVPASGYSRGRPRYDISRDQLEYFIDMGFTVPSMAEMLHVSVRTIERRLSAYSLRMRAVFSQLSDDDLDREIRRLKIEFPDIGYRMMSGLLRGSGIIVQQRRVREALLRCDPHGVCVRWLTSVHRRRAYTVQGPKLYGILMVITN